MLKRMILIFLIMLLIASMTACTGNPEITEIDMGNEKQVINPQSEGEQRTITIAVPRSNRYELMNYYKIIFEKELGVKVKFDLIKSQNYKEFCKGLASKLYTNKGPDLIYIVNEPYYNLIEQGIAMDVTHKIPNLKKVYSGLINEKVYKVPIGMVYLPMALNKNVLGEIGVEVPDYNWTADDYYKIREKWLKQGPAHLTRNQLDDIYYFAGRDKIKMFDAENKKVTLNTPEVKDYLRNARKEIFSGRYIINKDYTYENFYNMLYEKNSEEFRDFLMLSFEHEDTNELRLFAEAYLLKAKRMNGKLNICGIDAAYLPSYDNEEKALFSWGLIVNKNGENVELALQFINGLLSDEVQMKLYDMVDYDYPVNKEIEQQIKNIENEVNKDGKLIINEEILEFKDHVLKNMKKGVYKPHKNCSLEYNLQFEFKSMIKKELDAIIFADEEYTEDELTKALQDLERKYDIYMNE